MLMKFPRYPIPDSILPLVAILSLLMLFIVAGVLWYAPSTPLTLAIALVWVICVVLSGPIQWAWYESLDLAELGSILGVFLGVFLSGPGAIVPAMGSAGIVGMVAVAPSRVQDSEIGQVNSAHAEVDHFLGMLFGGHDHAGYFNVRYCAGDPAKDPLSSGGWWHWPEQRTEATAHAVELASRHGDVYVSRSLFSLPALSAAHALPTRVLFVDDAPRGHLPYSAVVRTGANLPQAWYILDRVIPGDAAARAQQRIAYALGADKSGADITQIVRFPIGQNTKSSNPAPVPVTLASCTGAVYTCEQVAAAYPPLAVTSSDAAPVDLERVDYWRGNLHSLTGQHGMPRRAKNPNAAAYLYAIGSHALDKNSGQILPVEQVSTPDTSRMRYAIGVWLFRLGYPDPEWWVLMEKLADLGATERKGTHWLQADLSRLMHLCKRNISELRQTPTRAGTAAPAPLEVHEPPRKGRPTTLTTEQYINTIMAHTDGVGANGGRLALLSVDDCAALLSCSRSTIERVERQLRGDNALIRHISPCRDYSYVEIFSPVKNATTPRRMNTDSSARSGIFDGTKHRIVTPETGEPHARVRGVHTPQTGLPPADLAAELAASASASDAAPPADLAADLAAELAASDAAPPADLAASASASDAAPPADLAADLAAELAASDAAPPADLAADLAAGACGGCEPPSTYTGAAYEPVSARSRVSGDLPVSVTLRERRRRMERLRAMSADELEREVHVLRATAAKARTDRQARALELQAETAERELGKRRDAGIREMYTAANAANLAASAAAAPDD
jgi:hypothetical protein